ncbi:triacylglycerol lipase [Pseudorhodoferax sp. Leaf267]|uniref:esterase/lipase family protein n=1 Tax=Pseudorhodoferax sp. Leaf267 TaxID=1736316 RepID=UPI0006FEF565|nr:alpha/beta fold hydrolase [Pseudorhodoferax sp. Leaf267]KQP14197.1 permease [Pseudorhodoferax sp. Leaf267]
MIARLQRTICLSLLLSALAWALLFWAWSPALALAGLALPALAYGGILACEFVLLARVRGDPVPRAGTAPLLRAWARELGCGLQVFAWRQPFRAHAEPDQVMPAQGRRGVVFVHGLMCNRGFWAPWMRRAKAVGMPCMAVNLEPVFGAIDDYVPAIETAVARMLAATGQPPVLICHSMGGLAARAWLRTAGARERVAHVVTIATPHAGTWMARFGQGRNSRQMRVGSGWLQALARGEPEEGRASFTCWYSDCDNIVFPVSTATLQGADNRFVPGEPHVGLAFHPEVMCASLALVHPRA